MWHAKTKAIGYREDPLPSETARQEIDKNIVGTLSGLLTAVSPPRVRPRNYITQQAYEKDNIAKRKIWSIWSWQSPQYR